MNVLGIETSCDETGIAIYNSKQQIMTHKLYSQVATHAKFGGVVPELASRDHVQKILPLVQQVLDEAKLELKDLTAIAYTAGPGLLGALLVGASFAKALGFALKIPVLAVDHMEAHLLTPLLESTPPDFPLLALLVSGGHTQLIEVAAFGKYRLLGETVDDAVGEAFDKVAKILNLSYPGGPAIEKLAAKGDAKRFYFPRPMTNRSGLNFSFSGLKTFVMNWVHNHANDAQTQADIACAFQNAVVDTLVIKCRRALRQTGLMRLVVAGGVSANQVLRRNLENMANLENAQVYYPRLEFCTDNGAMIAFAGWQHLLLGAKTDMEIKVYPRGKLGILP